MTDLPYTYTDRDGSELRIGRGYCTASDRTNHKTVSVDTPTGADAVDLARAVLAGDTGHVVISQARLAELNDRIAYSDTHVANAARSMRERAAEAALDDPTADYDIRRQIRALPLLPDDDTTPVYESDVESRLSALESLASDQADALEAQSQLIDTLRTKSQETKAAGIPTRPYNAWTDG